MPPPNPEHFPAEYYVKTPCYLTADGNWSPIKEDAGKFPSRELPYRFWDGCTFELVHDRESTACLCTQTES